MSNKLSTLLFPSIVLGGFITLLLFTTRVELKPQGDCSQDRNISSPHIQGVYCSGFEYGFPFKFAAPNPSVGVAFTREDIAAPVTLGVSSKINLDAAKLIMNIVLWSAISFGGLLALFRIRDIKAKK